MPTENKASNEVTSVNLINEIPQKPEDSGFVKLEDGGGLLLEDGSRLLLEEE